MDYLYGTFYILKNKIYNLGIFSKNVPRIEPKMPLYRQYSYFYSEPNQIIDGLYLGSSYNAYDIKQINNKNINVIINITDEIPNFYEDNLLLKYYKFSIKDNNIDDINPILTETYDIIDEHLSKGESILVHCFMGASRSASVIIHYLMKKNRWTYDYAKTFVIVKRPLVNLSEKFDEILKNI